MTENDTDDDDEPEYIGPGPGEWRELNSNAGEIFKQRGTKTDIRDRLVGEVTFLGRAMDNLPVFLAMAIVAALIYEPLQYRADITVFLPVLLAILAEAAKRNAHLIK